MRATGKNIELRMGPIIVSYNDSGPDNAPVIIFIHGFPLSKEMWQKQEAALMQNYRVISYDIRGHGKTQAGSEEFSIELFANDLVHFMDILDIAGATICGLSMGGYIALRAMEKYPERFNAIILSDTQCIADTPEGKEKRMKTIESIQTNGKEAFAAANIKNLFAAQSFVSMKEETDNVLQMTLNMDAENICNTLLALAKRDETCSRLEEIKVPALILVGKEDKITPPERSRMMNEKIKNSEMHIIDNSAHLPNIENAEAFNSHLKNFLFKVTR